MDAGWATALGGDGDPVVVDLDAHPDCALREGVGDAHLGEDAQVHLMTALVDHGADRIGEPLAITAAWSTGSTAAPTTSMPSGSPWRHSSSVICGRYRPSRFRRRDEEFL